MAQYSTPRFHVISAHCAVVQRQEMVIGTLALLSGLFMVAF